MDPSNALEDAIRDKVASLEKLNAQISTCHIVVEMRHQSQAKGKLFHVTFDLTVPGKEIVVSRETHDRDEHADVYVALRDAYEAARKQLATHMDKMKDKKKGAA
jgi:ribosomal subunit interface protein